MILCCNFGRKYDKVAVRQTSTNHFNFKQNRKTIILLECIWDNFIQMYLGVLLTPVLGML